MTKEFCKIKLQNKNYSRREEVRGQGLGVSGFKFKEKLKMGYSTIGLLTEDALLGFFSALHKLFS